MLPCILVNTDFHRHMVWSNKEVYSAEAV